MAKVLKMIQDFFKSTPLQFNTIESRQALLSIAVMTPIKLTF